MNDTSNGSKNGNDQNKEEGVVKFPTLAERDRMRREKKKEEDRIRKDYRNQSRAAQRAADAMRKPSFFNFGRVMPFTRIMLFAYIGVFIALNFLITQDVKMRIIMKFGFVPAYFSGLLTGELSQMPKETVWSAPLGLITHVFIHADFMHLAFNTIMTLVFGIMIENVFGTRRTIIFYFLCAVAGALFHFVLSPYSAAPVVGASTAISGLFAAAIIILHEQGRIGIMADKGPWPIIGIWALITVIIGLLTPGNVAWQAHLGGLLGGAALYQGLRFGRIKF